MATTLTEFELIYRRLSPAAQAIIDFIRAHGRNLQPRDLAVLLRRLAEMVPRETLIRLLILMTRLGLIDTATLEAWLARLAVTAAAEGGAAAGAGAGTGTAAGGAGAGAAAGGAATLFSAVVAALAVLYAAERIHREATTEIELGDLRGTPCGRNTPKGYDMANTDRTITVRANGTRSSLNKAIRRAATNCAHDRNKCPQDCGGDLDDAINDLIRQLADSEEGEGEKRTEDDELLALLTIPLRGGSNLHISISNKLCGIDKM